MSDQENGANTPVEQDPIKNLKAEVERKLGNTNTTLAQMQKMNENLSSQLAELNKKLTPAAAPTEDLSNLFYKDPEKYAQIVADRAADRADKAVKQREASIQKTNSTLSQLQNEYPELSDSNSDLTKKAIELYNALPDDEKSSSMSYRLAVQSAAVDLGVRPKSKRPVDDEPVGGASYSNGTRRRSGKLDPATEELANIFGIDTNDAAVKERLIKRSQRDWNRYQPVGKK